MLARDKMYGPRLSFTDAASLLKYSFHTQKSVHCLDLCDNEYIIFTNKADTKQKSVSNYICTKEAMQKSLNLIFRINVRLLETHNLEIARVRNLTVKYIFDTVHCCSLMMRSRLLSYRYRVHDLSLCTDFFHRKLFYFIAEAFKNNSEKVKILKLCLRLMTNKEFGDLVHLGRLYFPYVSFNMLVFKMTYFHCRDSELIVEIFRVFRFDSFMLVHCNFRRRKEYANEFAFFLHHLHALKKISSVLYPDTISHCLVLPLYLQVISLLKYQNSGIFSSCCYSLAVFKLEWKGFEVAEITNLQRQKIHFLVLLTHIVRLRKSKAGEHALRLLWRSIRVPFFTLQEFEDLCGHVTEKSEREVIYSFYTDIIGQDVPDAEPRELRHLCRCTIREVMQQTESLPSGIGKLGMPLPLQKYLELRS